MAFVRNWLHCVWGTKDRIPYLTDNIREKVIEHVKQNAKGKTIYIDTINGYEEHLHCIISLKADQTLGMVMQLIKGESSFWINKNKLTRFKFEWAVEYFAISVSESNLNIVRSYIRNQESHHKKKTWEEEYNELVKRYGFDKDEPK